MTKDIDVIFHKFKCQFQVCKNSVVLFICSSTNLLILDNLLILKFCWLKIQKLVILGPKLNTRIKLKQHLPPGTFKRCRTSLCGAAVARLCLIIPMNFWQNGLVNPARFQIFTEDPATSDWRSTGSGMESSDPELSTKHPGWERNALMCSKDLKLCTKGRSFTPFFWCGSFLYDKNWWF